jgi:hypothetical protein
VLIHFVRPLDALALAHCMFGLFARQDCSRASANVSTCETLESVSSDYANRMLQNCRADSINAPSNASGKVHGTDEIARRNHPSSRLHDRIGGSNPHVAHVVANEAIKQALPAVLVVMRLVHGRSYVDLYQYINLHCHTFCVASQVPGQCMRVRDARAEYPPARSEAPRLQAPTNARRLN